MLSTIMPSSALQIASVFLVLATLITRTEAKCQIVCHEWADGEFSQCNNAEVKCANNLPEGYYCLKFSTTRPPVCLEMVLEEEMRSSPRPRRYHPKSRQPIDYAVDKAPNVQLLP